MSKPARGLCVAFLGIDGSGKSTLLQLLGAHPPAWCAGATVRHLSPLRLRRHGDNTQPHATPPRGPLSSLTKCAYWFLEYSLGYRLKIAPELARGRLVLFDRYLVDALIDPRRYRYGGPAWVLELLWRLVPKPDLIVFLDAPVDVLESRKQEIEHDTMVRLRAAYQQMVAKDRRGRLVDVSGPVEQALANVLDLLVLEAGAAPDLVEAGP